MADAFADTAKVALFGTNSTGKTLQIRSLIEAFGWQNVGIVSCEHGLDTIASSLHPEMVRECDSIDSFKRAWNWAAETLRGRDQWVCVDGGSRVLEWIAGEVWAGTDAAYIKMATGTPRNELDSRIRPFLRFITSQGDVDSQRQWVQIGRDIDFELNRWAKLPCSIYWTFWEQQTSLDQYRKGLPWQADAPGNAGRDKIYGTFDVIMRLTVQGEKIVATHDREKRVVRSKVREDWGAGIKVAGEQVDFKLGEFVKQLRPQTAAKERA